MERKQVEVEDVSLGEDDYEGDNEDVIRVNPSDINVQSGESGEEPE